MGVSFFCQLSILPYTEPSQFGTHTVNLFFFKGNVLYNKCYGYKLARNTCGLNRLVSTSTPAKLLCSTD